MGLRVLGSGLVFPLKDGTVILEVTEAKDSEVLCKARINGVEGLSSL